MLDRASCFADPEIIATLTKSYVPVALDVWYEQRREDAAGELYKKIVTQREGLADAYEKDVTTQGMYISTPSGRLVRGWNSRSTANAERFLRQALREPKEGEPRAADARAPDARFVRDVPEGAVVVDVFSKITDAKWPETKEPRWDALLRQSLGRDHLWILADELAELRKGRMPPSLTQRLVRFHLIDNTRGEPPMWREREVKTAELALEAAGEACVRLAGNVRLATDSEDRGYDAALLGEIEWKGERLARFDLVARGRFHGRGTYTPRAPEGEFTLQIAFALSRGGTAASVPPQGARELREYLGR